MAEYIWRENMACRATWTIMSSQKFMNQALGSFDNAKTKKMNEMRFWPKVSMSSAQMDGLAWAMGQRFLRHLVETYTKKKQNRMDDSAEIIQSIANVFKSESATLTDLAEAVDKVAAFPDEK